MLETYMVGGPYPHVTICRRVPEQDDPDVGFLGLEPICELVVSHLATETQKEAQGIVDILNQAAEWRELARDGTNLIASISKDATFYPEGAMNRFLGKARKMGLVIPK